MSASKEKRRYPKRYTTEVPVEFLDKSKTKGMLVNLSRDGILVTAKKLKPINAFVRLNVLLPGSEKGVTINGKIVRHTVVNEVDAMGIQFLELDAAHRDVWLNYMSQFSRNAKIVLKNMVVDEREEKSVIVKQPEPKSSQFILRFKSAQRVEEFFPQDWKNEDFFIRTDIKKDKGDKVTITMVHPVSQEQLQIKAVVQKYDRHPVKADKEGLFFKIAVYDSTVESQIRKFLKIETYDD